MDKLISLLYAIQAINFSTLTVLMFIGLWQNHLIHRVRSLLRVLFLFFLGYAVVMWQRVILRVLIVSGNLGPGPTNISFILSQVYNAIITAVLVYIFIKVVPIKSTRTDNEDNDDTNE